MFLKKVANVTAFTLLLVTLSCSGLPGRFMFMGNLKEAIAERYDTEAIEIKIMNTSHLTVLLRDEKFENLPPDMKANMALEIGALARDLKSDDMGILEGTVTFNSESDHGLARTVDAVTFTMYHLGSEQTQ